MAGRFDAAPRRNGRGDFVATARHALSSGDLSTLPWDEVQEVLTLATRAYAAKVESEGVVLPALHPASVTPTEVVVTVSEMIRAAGLNPFDLAMWFRRPTLDRKRNEGP
jgi:hypothetical protein